jgi:hypothetical protein
VHGLDRRGIASRIRALLRTQDQTALAALAERLKLPVAALRAAVDALAPMPGVDVLAAIVAEYGVDPSWLVTGEYDLTVHRSVLDREPNEIAEEIRALLRHIEVEDTASARASHRDERSVA